MCIYNEKNENLPDLIDIYQEVEPTIVPDSWVEDFQKKYVPDGHVYIDPNPRRGNETTLSVYDVITAFKTLAHQGWFKEAVQMAVKNNSFHPDGEPNLDGAAKYKLGLFYQWWPLYIGRDILDEEGRILKYDDSVLGLLIGLPATFFHQGMPLEEIMEIHVKPFLLKKDLPIKHEWEA